MKKSLVKTVIDFAQENWHDLPGPARAIICAVGGALLGYLQTLIMDPGHIDWHHLPSEMLSVAGAALLAYALPNARTPRPPQLPKA